jgi:Domain of unknown function (DUF4263)
VRPGDPDEKVEVPTREIHAALAIADGLLVALAKNEELFTQLSNLLPNVGDDAWLPEVGIHRDTETLRLHLHRIVQRLRPHVPIADISSSGVLADEGVVENIEGTELKIRRPTRAYALEGDELASAAVWWDEIQRSDVDALRAVIETAKDERPIQRHLARNPHLLVQHMGGGHGRWVLSQKRLGSEYVPDFVMAERSTGGFEWQFVELQSPRERLFVASSGRQSRHLDEGIRQIFEWRRWLGNNFNYAQRSRSKDGLGLTDISARDTGLLLIGRAVDLDENDKQRRKQLDQETQHSHPRL